MRDPEEPEEPATDNPEDRLIAAIDAAKRKEKKRAEKDSTPRPLRGTPMPKDPYR